MRICIRSKEVGEDDDSYDSDIDYSADIHKEHVSFRGQRLQVITKIVDYKLSPGETYTKVWHVEGMYHEEIVATALYFEREDEFKGGNILFKRACHSNDVPQGRKTS